MENYSNEIKTLSNKLSELEMKLTFQEDTIDTLNELVAKQGQELQDLWTANKILKQSLNEVKSAGAENEAPEPPPPHY